MDRPSAPNRGQHHRPGQGASPNFVYADCYHFSHLLNSIEKVGRIGFATVAAFSISMKFTHLHVHSHYSLLDGLAKVDELVKRAGDLGFDSLALTDHGVLYGAIEFYQKARRAGIKPIIGVELYVAQEKMTDKRPGIDDRRYHLTVLAKDYAGYQNLIQLVTRAHLEGFYYKPRVDKELLRAHARGLVALSGCLNGEIPKAILSKRLERAGALISEYQDIFGKENFYLELGAHPAIPEQKIVNGALAALAAKTGAKVVGVNDVHYARAEDREAQDILVSVQTGARYDDEDRLTMKADDFSMKSTQEMAEFFRDHPQAIAATQDIAERVSLEIPLGRVLLPRFPLPDGRSAESYLEALAREGLAKRYGADIARRDDPGAQQILERLAHELAVIRQTGFAPYFLIVADFVNWARRRGIVVGPGRGSGPSSLVAYATGITNIDPIAYGLPFERFLNPERVAPPDFDLDFSDRRRDEVIEYVARKYGSDRVAQIITFGTMAARAAVRDTGRALGVPYAFCDQVAKLIPFNPTQGMKEGWLAHCLENVTEFRELHQSRPDARRLIDAAMKLEGVARHASTHACGVVIAPGPLTEYVPLQYATRHRGESRPPEETEGAARPGARVSNGGDDGGKVIVTQYEMHAIEDLGLLKIDFLGLRNLTIIEDAVKLIGANHGIDLGIDAIPLDDREAFRIFREGRTNGVFQFESQGIKRYLKELAPTVLEDLIAMVALYRPGPIELLPSFIARKHGREKITYLHPKLEPILHNTYGVGIYQEQMMQIARDVAGFTLSEADTLRRAIGKKIKSLLAEQREKLLAGMVMNRIDAKTAQAIWELFPPFARYGFNRCLTGDATVMDPVGGRLVSLQELYQGKQERKEISSLEPSQKIRSRPITAVVYNGRKPVWRLTTRSGRTIKATANHPFLTPGGWRKLEDIGMGTKLATPRTIAEPSSPLTVKPHKLGLLGYLLAEGNLCHPHGFYFYSKSREEISDYLRCLEAFPNTVGRTDERKPAIAVYAKRENPRRPAGAVRWIERLGLKYRNANEKFFPDFVYRLSNRDLALLIGKMFQGDGCISTARRDPQIFYATSSPVIARGLQHLLLRFGIISTIHEKRFKYRGGIKRGYTVTINRYSNIGKFLDAFGRHFVGGKAAAVAHIRAAHPLLNGTLDPWAARGSYDTIPVALVREHMRSAIRSRYASFAEFAWQNGISERLFGRDQRKVGYLRETVSLIADRLGDSELATFAESDIYWDEVASIEYVGEEDTYDLTVDETHNFVANDIIVHNSHAACYALIAYQTAYLKAHWPAEFMAALMTAEGFEIERVGFLVDEARSLGIAILPPSVNASNATFTVISPSEIRFGLGSVKNVGTNVVQAIIAARKSGRLFRSLDDFIERVESKDLNKKSLESLVRCGVLDELGERGSLLANMDRLLEYARDAQRTRAAGQASLFGRDAAVGRAGLRLEPAPPVGKKERLAWEKELLGLYVTEHPLEEYRERIGQQAIAVSALSEQPKDAPVTVAGLVAGVNRIVTKAGSPMLFVKLEDLTGKAEVLVFPRVLEKTAALWQPDKVVLVKGRVSRDRDEPKVLADEVIEVA